MKTRTVAMTAAMVAICYVHARELTWTGSENSEWNTTARNWTDADGNATFFAAGDSAKFTVAEGNSLTIEIGSDLTVSNAVFDVAGEMTVTTNTSATEIKSCCTFIKRGSGTLTVDGRVNSSTNAVVVEAGVLRGGGVPNNIKSGFGDAQSGYSVEVMPGAKFWVWTRNTLGGDSGAGKVDIIVHTNGVFSTKLRPDSADTFLINSAYRLTLDGGTLELPEAGHGTGFLRISELMSFAGPTPYLLTAEVDTHIIRLMGEQVEFRVPDITGAASGAAVPDDLDDVVFDMPIAVQKARVDAGDRFGMVKTGAGRMKILRYFDSDAVGAVAPNGDLTVKEGVLEIAADVKWPAEGTDGSIRVNTNATLVLNKNVLSDVAGLTSNEYKSVTVDHGKLVFNNGGDSGTHIAFGDLTLDHAELDLSNWLPNVNYGQMSFHGKVTLRGDEPFVFTCHSSTVNSEVDGRIGFSSYPRRTEFDVPDVTGDARPDCIVSNRISQQRLHNERTWISAGLIKRGAGTMVLGSQKNEFDGDIDVYEGELWAGPDEILNAKGYLGPMSAGRTITVHPGATLYLPNRNVFGTQAGITNTAPLGTLVIGGTLKTGPRQGFILPDVTITNGGQIARGYGPDNYGRFMVREKFKVTGDAPFVWEAEKTDAGESNTRWDPVSLVLNGYPENVFEIDDVTGDSAVDATFGVPFIIAYGYFRTDGGNHLLDDWKFGFTKTGAGTMRITAEQHITRNNSTPSGFASRSFNGDAKVAAGTLRVDGDLSLSDTVRVAAGAYLAGTGLVNNVSIAEGGGFKVSASQRDRLRIGGDLSVGENVVVDVDLPAGAEVRDIRSGVFTVTGEITGAENFASATVSVNGVPEPYVGLYFDGDSLRIRYRYGTVMTVR